MIRNGGRVQIGDGDVVLVDEVLALDAVVVPAGLVAVQAHQENVVGRVVLQVFGEVSVILKKN